MHQVNIENAEYKKDYKIFVSFDDGKKGIIDLESFLFDKNSGVFKDLKNKENFKNFAVNFHTLVWKNGLDLAPEFLYNLLLKQNKK